MRKGRGGPAGGSHSSGAQAAVRGPGRVTHNAANPWGGRRSLEGLALVGEQGDE